MATNIPKKLGKYDVLDVVGRGGMGIVYKATDPGIGRVVAIKMVTGGFGNDPELLKRFYREAQSAGKLQHPNIVTIYDLGDQDGNPYMVMEYLEGESLESIIASRRPVPLEQKLNTIIQLCNALSYAHQHNVIHRDIKPANVMVLKDLTVKIVDFGIARIGNENATRPGQLMGSIPYMSPEQIKDKAYVDSRTDIFSVGIVLYQLLTNALPFDGKDMGAILLKIVHDAPPPLQTYLSAYPEELDQIIAHALAKNSEDRYPTADRLAIDLMRVQDELKRDMVSEYLLSVDNLIADSQWNQAKEKILQILRIDRQNSQANGLLRNVEQQIQTQKRSEQARELRVQAEQAIGRNELADALRYLDHAVELDSSSHDLLQLRNSIVERKARGDQLAALLHRAESALDTGDLEEAQKAVAEALLLDRDNREAQALNAIITRETAEQNKLKQVQGFLDEARNRIASRSFTAALDVLKKAAVLAPNVPGIKELANLAASGQEQEKRRKQLEGFYSEIEDALSRDNFVLVCARADEGLQLFPDDRGLLKFRKLAEKQRQGSEKRTYVEGQIAASRQLLDSADPDQSLVPLEEALERYPQEPMLISMLSVVKETLARRREEQCKADCLQRAKDAIRRKAYTEAIEILEATREEISSSDIDDLLQFAQEEAANYATRQTVDAAADQARQFIAADEYRSAIELLEATLAEVADEELSIILEDARRRLQEFNQRVQESITIAKRLLRNDRSSDAVRFLDAQSEQYGKSPEFAALLKQARHDLKRIQSFYITKENAREALSHNDFLGAAANLQEFRDNFGDTPDAKILQNEIEATRSRAATAAMEKALPDVRMLLMVRSFDSAEGILDSLSQWSAYAAPAVKEQYESFRAFVLSAKERQAANERAEKLKQAQMSDQVTSVEEVVDAGEEIGPTAAMSRSQLEVVLGQVAQIGDHYQDNDKVQSAIQDFKRRLTLKIGAFEEDFPPTLTQTPDRESAPPPFNPDAPLAPTQPGEPQSELTLTQQYAESTPQAADDIPEHPAGIRAVEASIESEQATRQKEAVRNEVRHAQDLLNQGEAVLATQILRQLAAQYAGHSEIDDLLTLAESRAQEQRITEIERQADAQAKEGHFEQALFTLEEGLKQFPDAEPLLKAWESVLVARERVEHGRVLAELTKILESVRKAPLSESTELLRHSTQVSARFLLEAQVGALLQQIEHEINLRLAQRQSLVEELEQLESASSQARSLEGLSQLLNHAQAIASADAEDEIISALDRVKTAADSRGQFISRLMTEINQVVESSLTAQSIEEAEQLLADAQGQAAAHPELDDLQEIMVRASAQVHGLICKELDSLSDSISQAVGLTDLDLIRQRAARIRDSHSADATVTDLCGQIEVGVQSARAKLLQIELNRLSEDQDALASKSQPSEIASHIGKLQELIRTFPESAEAQAMLLRAQESLERLEARINEQERVLAELTKIAESVRKVPLSESTELLRRSTEISAGFLEEAQVGALLEQIEHEVNLRLAQRQSLIEEVAQLESASSQARSLEGLSQLLNHAQAIASADAAEGEVAAALDRVKTAADSRGQFISRLMAEINQVVENSLTAQSIEESEQLLADAQGQAAAHPELDDLQEIMVRASAQVHDRRVEHELICKELDSLSASISQASGVAKLDLIRQKAAQIRDSHSADATATDLCGQIEVGVQSARAKLLQIELNPLSEEQDALASKSQPGEIASHIRKLQELIRTFPESAEAQAMLLSAQESLERLEARINEQGRVLAELTKIAESVRKVSLSESKKLLRRSTKISAGFLEEAQVGALLQQIEHEVNLRLAQRQSLVEELEQLESASSQARSLEGLSQLLNHAQAIASADAEEGEVAAALDRVKTAADSRGQFISRSMAEINQVVESSLTAQSIEEAEQLLADAQGQAAAHPELDDLQEIMVRASAQVHDRRVEHDLICKELDSLSASVSHATGGAELDLIRQKAAQIRDSHSADATVTDLCGQIEVDVRSARTKLLQIELNPLSEEQDALASKSQPEEIASHIRKLQELIKTFPESVEAQAMLLSAQESLERLEARINEQKRVLAELTKIAESVRKVPLSESTELLRRSTQISAGFLKEAQVGALLQQIEHEVSLRLAQRQTLIEEMEQLESASSQANSLEGLSKLLNHAQAIASADAEEGEVAAALGRVKTAAESRRQFISRSMAEINQIVESSLTAKSIEEAEQLLADAQGQAAAYPELDDLQKIMVRASAQVHDRRVEHDLICKELDSLSASISQASGVAELDLIRQKAAQIRDSHSADATVTDLCGQIEVDVRSARAKLLQIELNRLSEKQDAASSQSQPEIVAHIRKLQELIKTFPESTEARAMLLRAQESLERLERARRQAEARATAITLEINACTTLFESKQPAKALSAIEQAVAKYPESEGLQSLLVKCRERIATEEEAQRQANERRAALQAAIAKGTDLLRTDRFEEAAALLEVACTQWPDEKQLQKLLSTARKSANRQKVAQQKKTQVLSQVSAGPTRNPRKLLLISGVVAVLLLLAVLVVPRVINLFARPHLFVLNVESLPSGADVEVDGHKCTTPHCSFKLPTGTTYTVKADLKGYVSTSQSVTLRNDQTISLELAREQQPAPIIPPPERGQPPALAKLVVKGFRSGDQLFVDDVRVPASGAPGTWDLTPGSHRLRLVEGKQDLIADPRQFKPNATVQLDRRDFRQPPPATSAEQSDWARVSAGGDITGLEGFLRTYPNSPLRPQAESKLEDLYWSRANSSGSIPAFQEYVARYSSPAGPHLSAALAAIARLQWESLRGTKDPSQVRKFLDQHPTGEYHDLAVTLLDDLTWGQAIGKGDTASLKGYLSSYPSGRHKDEATKELARLAPAPAPAAPPAPPPTGSPKVADRTNSLSDLDAIRGVLENYKAAYDTKNLAMLQEIWPEISSKQVSGLRTAFRDAGKVTLTYVITKGPDITGDSATVIIDQQLKANMSATSRVTMTLKKQSTQGNNAWRISSIR